MKYYHVYILKCSDGSFYTGVCNNVEKRLEEHIAGEAETAYTFARRPLQLAYSEEFSDINQAIEREKQIKRWSRIKKQALIEENWSRLVLLSKNYSQFGHPSTGSG